MTEIAWYWHFLGLLPGASKADIKSAYHRLAKLLHRDHGGTDQDMQRLNEAYRLAMSDNGPAHQEPPRPKPPPPPPPRPQAARAPMFNSPRKWRPLFIGACIGLAVGAVRSIITYDASDLFGGPMGGVLLGAMYEMWEWFVYTVRTKFAKKAEVDRRLVLAVFIGFWALVTLIDFDFSSTPTPTAVSKDRIKRNQLIPALTLNQIQQEESSVDVAGTFQNTNPTGPVYVVMVTWQVISCDKRWKSLTIKYGERIPEGCTQVCSKQISTDVDVGPGQSGDFHAEIPCPDDHDQNMIRKVRWNVEGAYRWE